MATSNWYGGLGLAAFLASCWLVACSSASGGGGGLGGATGGSTQSSAGGTSASGGVASIGGRGTGGDSTARGGAIGSGGLGSGGAGTGGLATGGAGGAGSGGVLGNGGSDPGATTAAGGARSGGETGAGASATGGRSTTATGGGGTGGTSSATGGTTAGGHGGATTASGGAGTGGTGAGGSTACAGRALSLAANGTGSANDTAFAHVEIDLGTDLPTGNAKRTVEFWAFIRSTDWVGEKNQIFYYGGSEATGSFGLDFGTNNVAGSTTNHATLNPFTGSAIRDDSGKDLGIDSSTDQWVHVAMTWDGTVLTTYVNGVPKITAQGSGGTTTLATAQSVLMLGCNPTNNNCFAGLFDELRVWNVARAAAEIKDGYQKPMLGNETGLVGYWKFDETSGTAAADAVTATGHTAHRGTLKADTTAHLPTFVFPATPVPLVCP